MWNGDIEVSVCKPTEAMDGFYRNGEGDEVVYVHRGTGVVRTMFGPVAYREKDYVVIPRGTTHRWEPDDGSEQHWMCFHTPGEIETPNRYRNRYGQLLEHAPYSQRDFHPPAELETFDETGEWTVTLRVRDGLQTYVLDRHPFDVVGWDGYVYPYTFNAADFEPRAGRFHLPPPAHQTFQGPNFVICTFAPRMLDWDETAVPLPYHHSNIQSEEVMFYAEGDYAARKGVDVGCLTLHPSGLPHGPQPGTVEKALGATRTDELAVMWDTFRPLRLSTLWRDIDDPSYAYSWNPDRAGEAPGAGANGGAPAGRDGHRAVGVISAARCGARARRRPRTWRAPRDRRSAAALRSGRGRSTTVVVPGPAATLRLTSTGRLRAAGVRRRRRRHAGRHVTATRTPRPRTVARVTRVGARTPRVTAATPAPGSGAGAGAVSGTGRRTAAGATGAGAGATGTGAGAGRRDGAAGQERDLGVGVVALRRRAVVRAPVEGDGSRRASAV